MTKLHKVANLGPHQAAVDAALREMVADSIMARIWAHDHTVWSPDPTEITNRLGWLHTAEVMLPGTLQMEHQISFGSWGVAHKVTLSKKVEGCSV